VLDVGAGVGAMSLGLLDYLARTDALAGRPVSIRAVDRDGQALGLMRAAVHDLAARRGASVELEVECADVTRAAVRGAGGAYDLVLAGSVMNELDEPARQALTRAMLAAAGDRGFVIIVEPALREVARDLHRL